MPERVVSHNLIHDLDAGVKYVDAHVETTGKGNILVGLENRLQVPLRMQRAGHEHHNIMSRCRTHHGPSGS
jgi:hypothetical protein